MNDMVNTRDAASTDPAGTASKPPGGEGGKGGEIIGTMFWAGLIGGCLIIAMAFVALGISFAPPLVSILIICSGLGIVFCAYGSKAEMNMVGKGAVITGSAATCLLLFMSVMSYIQKSIVKIDVSGVARGASVDLFGSSDQQIFGAPRHKSYQFIAFADDLDSKWLSLDIVLAATPGAEGAEILFDCVPRSAIDRHMGSGETLQWRVDMDKGELVAYGDKPAVIAKVGSCRNGADTASSMRWPSLIATAHAQAPPGSIAQSLRDLNSESTALRRDARKSLAAQGSDGVKPLMRQWTDANDSYRVRLGSAVALAEMLRSRKAERSAVSAQLSDDDLALIARSLSDEDRTVRIYAGEFLTDLGDKRLVPIALQQLRTASGDGQYNLALVLESAAPELSAAERAKLRADLGQLRADTSVQFGPQTQEKLNAVANVQ